VCRECQTIDQLPLFDGPKELEAQDPLLDSVVRRHVQRHGDMRTDAAALLVADDSKPCNCELHKSRGPTFWEGHRDDILKNLGERWTGFHPEFYATKDTFQEDAMRCYNIHRRPKGTDCIDYHDDSRRLTPANWKGREVYLCDFCPVSSTVTTAIRHAAGMYKRESGDD
jgi:hypothetical protein